MSALGEIIPEAESLCQDPVAAPGGGGWESARPHCQRRRSMTQKRPVAVAEGVAARRREPGRCNRRETNGVLRSEAT
jgi:hypothetical protein